MLKLARGLEIPNEAQVQTFAIIAKRGVGKTYTAMRMVEQMLDEKLRVVVVDPVGVCWGLRSNAAGTGPGKSIIVFGGEHGDLPLEDTSGELIADTIIDHGISAVLDLSGLRKAAQVRFVTAFAERIYYKNRDSLHIVLDEGDAFAPQRPMPGERRMLGAVEDLVRRGRARGIGLTLVTQRAAVLNKDVLTQCEVLVAMRTVAPHDRKALEEWIKYNTDAEQAREVLTSLAKLDVGEAWFWSPGWLKTMKRVRILKRATFDSSATPEAGSRKRKTASLAPVDLDALREKLAESVQRAEKNDPKALRRRIAELEAAKPEVRVEEVPILKDGELDPLISGVTDVRALFESLEEVIEDKWKRMQAIRDAVREDLVRLEQGVYDIGNGIARQSRPKSGRVDPSNTAAARHRAQVTAKASGKRNVEERILDALSELHALRIEIVPRSQLALFSGYKHPRSKGFLNALGSLRSGECVEYVDGGVVIKSAGIGRAVATPPDSLAEYQERICSVVKGKSAEILRALWKGGGGGDRAWLAGQVGYAHVRSKGFLNALGALRSLGLVRYVDGDVALTDAANPASLN